MGWTLVACQSVSARLKEACRQDSLSLNVDKEILFEFSQLRYFAARAAVAPGGSRRKCEYPLVWIFFINLVTAQMATSKSISLILSGQNPLNHGGWLTHTSFVSSGMSTQSNR